MRLMRRSEPPSPRSTHESQDTRNEPLPRSADLLQKAGNPVRRWAWRGHRRATQLGGRLSQALAARQNRPLHAWRELHRLVLMEDLRQGRDRHLGDAADRLSAHAPRPAQPRATRLRAWGELFVVSLFGQPGEAPDGARPPAETVARGPHPPLPCRRLGLDCREKREPRKLHLQARPGRAGAGGVG